MRTHLFTRGDKDDTFHLEMTLDESPQSVKFPIKIDDCVVLFQIGRYHSFFSSFVTVDVERVVER